MRLLFIYVVVSRFKFVCKYTINGDEDIFNLNYWNSWRVSTETIIWLTERVALYYF